MELTGAFGKRVSDTHRYVLIEEDKKATDRRSQNEERNLRLEAKRLENLRRSLPRRAVEALVKVANPEPINDSDTSWVMFLPLLPTKLDGKDATLKLSITVANSGCSLEEWREDPDLINEFGISLIVESAGVVSRDELPNLRRPTKVEHDIPDSTTDRDEHGFSKFTYSRDHFTSSDIEAVLTAIQEACSVAGIDTRVFELDDTE